MQRFALLAFFLLFPLVAAAAELPVGTGLVLDLEVPAGWELTREPPDYLVEEMAEHLGHELEAQGQAPSREKLENAARNRLAANEGYLFNPDSGSHLLIDFSPLKEGEKAPSSRGVALSAEYAGQGMEEEEGVTDSTYSTSEVRVGGADHARRLFVEYRHHDEPRKFVGLIGFASPAWFYLYYTDLLRNGEDLLVMEGVLAGLEVKRAKD